MADLHPLHWSFMTRKAKPKPKNMEEIEVDPRCKEIMSKIALDIFADMSNANYSFQSALTAIYMSGLQHGQFLGKQKKTGKDFASAPAF